MTSAYGTSAVAGQAQLPSAGQRTRHVRSRAGEIWPWWTSVRTSAPLRRAICADTLSLAVLLGGCSAWHCDEEGSDRMANGVRGRSATPFSMTASRRRLVVPKGSVPEQYRDLLESTAHSRLTNTGTPMANWRFPV